MRRSRRIPANDNRPPEEEVVVQLSIPGRPEYVGVARLAILGVSSRMRFSYDEVEDIRLAVGEACTTAVERAELVGFKGQELSIRCKVTSSRLDVEVSDNVPEEALEVLSKPSSILDERCLGGVLIRILMDDVENFVNPVTGGRGVRMTKYTTSPTR